MMMANCMMTSFAHHFNRWSVSPSSSTTTTTTNNATAGGRGHRRAGAFFSSSSSPSSKSNNERRASKSNNSLHVHDERRGAWRVSWRLSAHGGDENGTGGPYSTQSWRLLNDLLTVQAIKTLLVFLQETNGELHLFLHNYLVDNPLPKKDDECTAEQWLANLACTPLTSVSDPRRSSVCGPAGEEAYLRGQREVSPRDIAERVLSLRQDLAKDFIVELEKVPVNNEAILRRALTQSYSEMDSTTSGSE